MIEDTEAKTQEAPDMPLLRPLGTDLDITAAQGGVRASSGAERAGLRGALRPVAWLPGHPRQTPASVAAPTIRRSEGQRRSSVAGDSGTHLSGRHGS